MPTAKRSVGAGSGSSSLAHDGWTVLLCRSDGSIAGGSDGLWDHDARILSLHVLELDGQAPQPVGGPRAEGGRWSATLRVPRGSSTPDGPALPQDAWELAIDRGVGPGMRETLVVRNHSMAAASATLTLDLDADFGDALTRGEREGPRHRVRETVGDRVVEIRGTAREGDRTDERGVRVAVLEGERPDIEPRARGHSVRFAWPIELGPHGQWRAVLDVASLVDGEWRDVGHQPQRDALRLGWQARRTRVEGEPNVGRAIDRAAEDLLALRNWDLEPERDGSGWIPNAGVPWFTGLFGRDVLTTGWQSLMLGPEIARGALEVTARSQGTRTDAWTEEEPGRLIHEHRRGPLAVLARRPHARYYGNQTAPSFFPVALTETWHWTGDDDLLRRHRDTAWRAIEWARRSGDRDGDGFLEYRSSSHQGLRNQGWKDSDEAIRWPDGRIVDVPIATIEEQAFHYLALQRMAEISVALDEPGGECEGLLREAATLRERIESAYWDEGLGYYAMALDADKRPVLSIGSNPLHALAAGVVAPERATAVADRLLGDDLFGGWGIRTLAASHPSYNPFAYHLGAVWPVENATALIGFRRYGLDRHLDRLVEGFLAAVGACPDLRVPEALTGHPRGRGSRPLPYPESCPIQAWSASAVVQAVQAMLGLYPFAPLGALAIVRPRLPDWLPALTVRRLRVGRATVSLRFERHADGSATHEVLEQDGPLLVVTGPPPNAATGKSPIEWIAEAGIRVAPGRHARALRIALGLEPVPGAEDGRTGAIAGAARGGSS
jgi:glycogen debranching enzyme